MRKAHPVALCLLALVVMTPLVGCSKMQARVEMRKGNDLYKKEDFKGALAQFQKGLELDPGATFVWRSVGLSAMALFRPDSDSPENKRYGEQAIEAFKKYLASYPNDEKVKDYLLTSYMNAERYGDALAYLKAEQAKKPTDLKIDNAIVTVLLKQDKLQDAYDWARSHASKSDPTVYYSLGVTAWDKAYRGGISDPVQKNAMIDFGMKLLDEALRLNKDYADAMVYKGLLIRERVKMIPEDPVKQQELVAEAEALRKKAIELKKKAEEEAAKQANAASA